MKNLKRKPAKKQRSTSGAKVSNLLATYRAASPEQVQMRIMWMTLKQLTRAAFGESEENRKIIAHYDAQWKLCDMEISMKAKRLAKN